MPPCTCWALWPTKWPAGVDPVNQLGQRRAQGLAGDVAIGHLPGDKLERADHAAELLALADVLHRAQQLLRRDTELQCGQAGHGAWFDPGQRGLIEQGFSRHCDALQAQIGHGQMMLGAAFDALNAGQRQVQQHEPQGSTGLHRQQSLPGLLAQRHSRYKAIEPPGLTRGRGPQ